MDTLGIAHLGLSVEKLDETTAFFTEALGWKLAKEVPSYPAKFVTNGSCFLTLWQTDPNPTPFNRKTNVGLHHVAIKVPGDADLEALFTKITAHPGVTIDFSPENLGSGPTRHFMIFEPGGIRVEFVQSP